MNFKKSLLVVLSVTSSFGWTQPMSQPMAERPPRFPDPGRPSPSPSPAPSPSPRPEPRPEPRPSPSPAPTPRPEPIRPSPSPRPEPSPAPRPEPIRPSPSPRPDPAPAPRPEPPRPSPRPEPPAPRPEPPRPEPRPPVRPEPRPPVRPDPTPAPRPEPRPPVRPEPPRPDPRPPVRPDPRPEPRPPVRPEPPRPPVRPEPPRPRPPGPVRPHPRPYPPRPVKPLPPRPQPPIVRPDPGQYFSQVVNLNRVIQNQHLDLMQLLNLNRLGSNYTVESVVVKTSGRNEATMRLWVNNQVDDVVSWPSTIVSLYPRYDMQLGLEMRNLTLQVEGAIHIQQIEVRLRQVGWTGDYYQVRVPVELYQNLYEYDVLHLHQWIDLTQYQGYRLIGVEVEADAFYAAEKLSLIIDESISGEAYVIGENAEFTLFPEGSVVIGSDANRISLMATGSGALTVKYVTLRLSRY